MFSITTSTTHWVNLINQDDCWIVSLCHILNKFFTSLQENRSPDIIWYTVTSQWYLKHSPKFFNIKWDDQMEKKVKSPSVTTALTRSVNFLSLEAASHDQQYYTWSTVAYDITHNTIHNYSNIVIFIIWSKHPWSGGLKLRQHENSSQWYPLVPVSPPHITRNS